MKTRLVKLSVIFCISVLVSGCNTFPPFNSPPREVKYNEDIANVFVTALPPMAFNDLQESLAIQHGLTPADCRQLAAQTTRSDVYQLLSQISFGIGLALPARAVSNTSTTTNGVATSTNTSTTGSATIPTSSGIAANGVSESSLSPDIAKSAQSFGLDGEASILGGTALCQAAALAQQQISSAKLPEGYVANVVTFQVNVQPKARDLSYDTYVDLELWSNELSKGTKPLSAWGLPSVLVYPLIINDVLESTSIARSEEAIRQFSAALSGVMGSLGGLNAAYNNSQSQAKTVLGSDRNSILTMGRITDNTIRIRLGAPNSGSAPYAMVARTFNVSTLVLVKKSEPANEDGGNLTAISSHHFTSTDYKAVEPTNKQTRLEIAKKVAEALDSFDEFVLNTDLKCGGDTKKVGEKFLVDDNNMTPFLNLQRQIDRQDFLYLNRCITPKYPSEIPPSCPEENEICKTKKALLDISRVRLYSIISHGKLNTSSSTSVIPLPAEKAAKLSTEINSLVVVEDDKKVATAILRGGKNLNAKNLIAYALFDTSVCNEGQHAKGNEETKAPENNSTETPKVLPCNLPASSVSVSADGTIATVTFPSFGKLKLTPTSIVLAKSDNKDFASFSHLRFPDSALTPEAKLPSASISAPTQFIVADANGNGSIGLTVDMKDIIEADKKAKKDVLLTPVTLAIQGASVVSAGAPIFILNTKGITITQSGTASISLSNLTPGQVITVWVVDKSLKKILSEKLSFTVDRSAHK